MSFVFHPHETRGLGTHDCGAINTASLPPQAILRLISSIMRLSSWEMN